MKLKNKTRLIIQLAIIAVVLVAVVRATDVEAYCPLGGLLSIGSRYVSGASSCQMGETQMFLGLALVFGIFVVGKLFCSHICPIGTVTEWLGRWGRKFKLQLKQMPKWLDSSLRSLKYLLLLPVLYYTATSNELFCKTFDPYFASTTGFSTDVVFWWALAAIAATVIGSLFIRQFWCKYLCPLNALSNLFMFSIFTLGTLGLYIGLILLGVDISIFWLFLIWVVGGFIIELTTRKGIVTPFMRIKRNNDTCIDCKLCDKECPYGIEVSKMDTVRDLDCTMCSDCVAVCPVNNCLTVSSSKKSRRWLPAVATGVLIVLGFGFSSQYEFSTLSEKWGKNLEAKDLAQYETTVKSVKCFGSATSLKRKIMREKGIYGLDAYATSHKVVLYYDPEEIDQLGLKKAIFSPYKSRIRSFNEERPNKISVAYLGIMDIVDNVDNINLIRTLQQSPYVYGFESNFGEPVRVLVYYNGEKLEAGKLAELVETKKVTYTVRGEEQTIEPDFSVEEGPEKMMEIDTDVFLQHIFSPYKRIFKEFKEADKSDVKIYEIGMPGLASTAVRRYLPYLSSHISNQDGILGLESFYHSQPVGWIYYDGTQIDTAQIRSLLEEPQMTVNFSNGETRKVDNPFKVKGPSQIRTLQDLATMKNMLEEKTASINKFHN